MIFGQENYNSDHMAGFNQALNALFTGMATVYLLKVGYIDAPNSSMQH